MVHRVDSAHTAESTRSKTIRARIAAPRPCRWHITRAYRGLRATRSATERRRRAEPHRTRRFATTSASPAGAGTGARGAARSSRARRRLVPAAHLPARERVEPAAFGPRLEAREVGGPV